MNSSGYMEQYSTAEKMRQLSNEYFNPKSCLYHYLHMARRNFKAYLQDDLVKMKKYFYVLRPILACKWIEKNETIAPMEFQALVDSQVESEALRNEIAQLMDRKIRGDEMELAPRIEIIHELVDSEIQRFNELLEGYNIHKQPDTHKLDALFQTTLTEVWDN